MNVKNIAEYFFNLQSNLSLSIQDVTQDAPQKESLTWNNYEGQINHWDDLTHLEKGAINVSHMRGKSLPKSSLEALSHLGGLPYEVAGISMIFHPRNPHAPTMHANLVFLTAKMFGGLEEEWT